MSPLVRARTRTITLGGLSATDMLAEDLVLPLLTGTLTVDCAMDALHDAVSRRVGIGLIGAKGAGKTEAVRLVCHEFEAAERARQALDSAHRRRRLLRLPTLVTPKYRDILTELLKQITGTETRLRVHGSPLSDDTLLARFCAHLFDRNVVAVVVDQAEACGPEALRALRDVMTVAADLDERRKGVDGVIASGVGVLLVGTPALCATLAASDERGHRWARMVEVHGVLPADVADIYLHWFPAFGTEVLRRGGRSWWEATLEGHVSHGQIVAMRSLAHHALRYWQHLVADREQAMTRETAPLDVDLFTFAATETDWQRSTATVSRRGA
jgi:hypothetical protein